MDKKEIIKRFESLLGQLSPENISCDGELNSQQIKFRKQVIAKEWKYLEGQLGREVSEDDVWMRRI